MRTVFKWIGIGLAALLAVLAVAAGLGALFWGEVKDWAMDYAAHRAGSALGREVIIDGPLKVDWSWRPQISVSGVQVANAGWAGEKPLIVIERLVLRIVLTELLTGNLVIPRLHLMQPTLRLRTSPQGQHNWTLPAAGGGFPDIGEILVSNGRIVYRDPAVDEPFTAAVEYLRMAPKGSGQGLTAKARGRLEQASFELTLDAGALARLGQTGQAYPLQARFTVGDFHGRIDGTVAQPASLDGIDAQVSAGGPLPDSVVSFWAAVLGLAVPELPPYQLEGRLQRNGQVWTLESLNATVGDAQLGGTVTVNTAGQRPLLRADLTTRNLDLGTLAGLMPARPGAAGQSAGLLPAVTLYPPLLSQFDAVLKLRGESVEAGGLSLHDFTLNARLQDGQLHVEPLAFDLAGGSVRLTLNLRGGAEPVQVAATAEARQLRLNTVLPGPDLSGKIQGVIGGRIDVKGTGARLDRVLASLDGRIELIMADGQVDARILEKMGLDLGEMLLTGKTQMVPIRCGIAVLAASDGVLTLKTFVLDTKDTKVTGRGTINLAERRLDLVLKTHAKDPSLLEADAPIHIEGSFRNPSLYPDKSALAAELGAAVALGLVAGPAALLPLVETGDAAASDCQALLDR